jgi:hypothetical protein
MCHLQRLRRDEETRNTAATWIQSRWRARKGRLSAHLLQAARQHKRERDAATFVQTLWRGKKGRNVLGSMKAAAAAQAKAEQSASMRMQALFRGFKDRKHVKAIRKRHALDRLKLEDLFTWAAVNIQKTYRGFVRACWHAWTSALV